MSKWTLFLPDVVVSQRTSAIGLYNFSLLPVTWTTQSSCSSSSLCALRLVNFSSDSHPAAPPTWTCIMYPPIWALHSLVVSNVYSECLFFDYLSTPPQLSTYRSIYIYIYAYIYKYIYVTKNHHIHTPSWLWFVCINSDMNVLHRLKEVLLVLPPKTQLNSKLVCAQLFNFIRCSFRDCRWLTR